eukprot:TRINITY_DN11676_c0_g2_i1.p1 TRINITY_DN11676_c0_g2~~TRINITY_DN11676_c0_g2_i1.p1  ORF type:complete len:277 (+),score=49.54 TRINITY_DN11676_c0_g2_i1:80-832(+)
MVQLSLTRFIELQTLQQRGFQTDIHVSSYVANRTKVTVQIFMNKSVQPDCITAGVLEHVREMFNGQFTVHDKGHAHSSGVWHSSFYFTKKMHRQPPLHAAHASAVGSPGNDAGDNQSVQHANLHSEDEDGNAPSDIEALGTVDKQRMNVASGQITKVIESVIEGHAKQIIAIDKQVAAVRAKVDAAYEENPQLTTAEKASYEAAFNEAVDGSRQSLQRALQTHVGQLHDLFQQVVRGPSKMQASERGPPT